MNQCIVLSGLGFTANSFLRQEHAGLVQLLTKIASETDVKIRILT
jgi:hypothetical protein